MENLWTINAACAIFSGYIASIARTRRSMWFNIAAALINVAAVIAHFTLTA